MQTQSKNTGIVSTGYALEAPTGNGMDYMMRFFSREDIAAAFEMMSDFKNVFQQNNLSNLSDLLARLTTPSGKKSFLVFKSNKYINVLTENIAFFYVKYESPVIMCFNK